LKVAIASIKISYWSPTNNELSAERNLSLVQQILKLWKLQEDMMIYMQHSIKSFKYLSAIASNIPTEGSIVQLCLLSWVVSRSKVIGMFVEAGSLCEPIDVKIERSWGLFLWGRVDV
jgi:hypothetical protein